MKLSFDVNKLIKIWMPELLRQPRHLAWLGTILKPVATLWSYVLSYRTLKLYEATITGETNRLTKALQDRYTDNGIYIIQPTDYLDTAWIYTENEPHFQEYDFLEEENHIPVEFDFLEEEYDPEFDFVVRVPNVLANMIPDMKVWLKKYVMAGKRYKIELY